jgi:hypothetical protein
MDRSHSNKHSHDHISQAYLIRFWRGRPDEPWRALAKQVADGREVYFAGPEELFLFLREQIVAESRRQATET